MRAWIGATTLCMCCVAGCASVPKLPPRRVVPSIPLSNSETWRCTAPGAPVVHIEGVPPPDRVSADGRVLECRLVPLGL